MIIRKTFEINRIFIDSANLLVSGPLKTRPSENEIQKGEKIPKNLDLL